MINLHSLENTAAGVFDFKISHRFGFVSGWCTGVVRADASTIRIGGDYGITNRLMVGFGRSYENIRCFCKIQIVETKLRQKEHAHYGCCICQCGSQEDRSLSNQDREIIFSSRLYYTWQVILGRKFSEGFSLQLSPTLVHRNLTATKAEKMMFTPLPVQAGSN